VRAAAGLGLGSCPLTPAHAQTLPYVTCGATAASARLPAGVAGRVAGRVGAPGQLRLLGCTLELPGCPGCQGRLEGCANSSSSSSSSSVDLRDAHCLAPAQCAAPSMHTSVGARPSRSPCSLCLVEPPAACCCRSHVSPRQASLTGRRTCRSSTPRSSAASTSPSAPRPRSRLCRCLPRPWSRCCLATSSTRWGQLQVAGGVGGGSGGVWWDSTACRWGGGRIGGPGVAGRRAQGG
jgi:hypothetical protein